jgi:Ni/Fe-hydrogenase 1 B-type cytochrome subunit
MASQSNVGPDDEPRTDAVQIDARTGRVAIATGDVGSIHRLSVFVFEWPIRLWHWVMVVVVIALAVSGYLIAHPPASPGSEASAHFGFAYIRFIHFTAGYLLAILFLFRVYWAFVGNRHAREAFLLPVHRRAWWAGLANMAAWYFFAMREPRKWVGHNPLAQLSMFAFMVFLVLMIATGFALYGEGAGADSWQAQWFAWVFRLFGSGGDVRAWHLLGMWALVIFTTLHVYTAVREDIMSRQSLISTMISGERMFKDDRPV